MATAVCDIQSRKLLLLCTQSEIVCNHLNQMLVNWGEDERQRIQTMELLMDCRKVRLLVTFHDLTCLVNDSYHVFFPVSISTTAIAITLICIEMV